MRLNKHFYYNFHLLSLHLKEEYQKEFYLTLIKQAKFQMILQYNMQLLEYLMECFAYIILNITNLSKTINQNVILQILKKEKFNFKLN